ncbi:hypothetical protein GCM10020221_10720 [Streptomyces thioluteus]|uniref:histidine kinase n=1 Tax=Streptomyces thioluteus TaxID=66431 RepID=A0ABN3WKL0_STRTU
MRRRLINSTLAVVLVVIAVFGISLVIVETRTIENSARESVQSEAVRLVSIVEGRLAGGERVESGVLRAQVTEDRYARVEIPGRTPIEIGSRPEGGLISSTESGEHGETVRVEESRATVSKEVGRTLLVILTVALLAVIAAVFLAVRQANRLTAPLTTSPRRPSGWAPATPAPRHRRYGVPELDRVADVLDASAERIARMLTAERRLAADASHQLRTPLTALSMRLEEITLTDDPDTVKEEATIALTQVERLTDVVQRLLTNSRDPKSGSAVTFDLDEVIQQQLDEWRPAIRAGGRALVRSGKQGLRAVGTPGAVSQVLATLIENSLTHGGRRGRAAHPDHREPGRRRGLRRGAGGPHRPGRAGLRADGQRAELHRARARRGPGPGRGGRGPTGAAPAEPAGLRPVPQHGGGAGLRPGAGRRERSSGGSGRLAGVGGGLCPLSRDVRRDVGQERFGSPRRRRALRRPRPEHPRPVGPEAETPSRSPARPRSSRRCPRATRSGRTRSATAPGCRSR